MNSYDAFIEHNYDINFDVDIFRLIKDKHYIYQLVDDLVELSKKIYDIPDFKYCRAMLYNSCIAPWYGTLPQFRTDVSVVTRDYWIETYLNAFNLGDEYLRQKFSTKS